jgi:hypothetical protein
VILVLSLLAIAGCVVEQREGTLPDLKTKIHLSMAQKVNVFSLIRKSLRFYPDMERALSIPLETNLPQICDREIFVTIFHEGSPQVTGVGREGCTQERILRAVVGLTNHPDFKKYNYMMNLESSSVKVDFLNRRKKLDFSKPLSKVGVEPGMDGLILQDGEDQHYQLPTDFIYLGWEPQKRSGDLYGRRLKIQLKHLCRQAGLDPDAYKEYPVYEFRAISWVQHRPDLMPFPLYRGTLLPSEFTTADQARGAAAAGDWLVNNIGPTGRFTYTFNPTTGKRSNFLEYNVSRHAGSVYALMHLYNQSLEPRYLERGIAAMEFLQRHLKPPLLEPTILAIRHPIFGTYDLGAAALTLLALCELPEVQFAKIGNDTTNRLARFILKMQLESGEFHSVYMRKLAGLAPDRPDYVVPGEALLALVRYYKKNPNVDWLEAAKRAADVQIKQFQKTKRADSWTVQGLAELFQVDSDPRYAEATFAMADSILAEQHKTGSYADYVGAFRVSRPPRTTPTARRMVALASASSLCWFLGTDSSKYDKAVQEGARFILWNQYRQENSFYLGLPETAAGAIRGGPVDPTIRMDQCQHAIIALTGAYKIGTRIDQEKSEAKKADK